MQSKPITVAWLSYFPIEWLSDIPEEVRRLPRMHAASWQRVLLQELEGNPAIRLHILVLRKQFERSLSFQRNGVTFHLIKVPGGLRAPSFFWLDTVCLSRVLKKIQPDVVHAWGTEQGAALVAQRLGYPRVVTIQGLMTWYAQVSPPSKYERLAGFLERHTLKRIPFATTEARFSVDYLKKHYPRLKVEQVEHAPAWIFHQLVRSPQTHPTKFLFVGAPDHRKGGDVLFQALDRFRNQQEFEAVIVGSLPASQLNALWSSVSSGLRSRLRFMAQLSPAEVAQQLSIATLMICASRADVSPNAVKEAVVAGVPVVGTTVGGIPDYVWPGKNGFLCPPGVVDGLVSALKTACFHPLFGRGLVEADALRKVRAYLAPSLMGSRFVDIYRSVAESGHFAGNPTESSLLFG